MSNNSEIIINRHLRRENLISENKFHYWNTNISGICSKWSSRVSV